MYKKQLAELQDIIDFLNEALQEFCDCDPGVGIQGPTEYQWDLVTELRGMLEVKKRILEEHLKEI